MQLRHLFGFVALLTPAITSAATFSLVHEFPTGGTGGRAIAVAPDGNIFVADYSSTPRIQRFDASGAPLGEWPTGWLDVCTGLAISPAGLVIAVQSLEPGPAKSFTTNGAPAASFGHFDEAAAVAVDGAGIRYILDGYNVDPSGYHSTIHKLDSAGNELTSWSFPVLPNDLETGSTTLALAPNGDVLAVHRCGITRFDGAGNIVARFELGCGAAPGQITTESRLACDLLGRMFVLTTTGRVVVFDSGGSHLEDWSVEGTDIAVSSSNHVFVTDAVHGQVLEFAEAAVSVRTGTWGGIKRLYR